MKPRVFIFINGILSWPGDHNGWTDRAVTWTQTRTEHKAEKWEYAAGALTRRLFQEERAESVAILMRYYETSGFEISLVGHSNGCDIIARILDLRGKRSWYYAGPVRTLHLLSAAADGKDFAASYARGDFRRLVLYVAGADQALRLGAVTRTLFGWAGLGYGSLGLGQDIPNVPGVAFRMPEYGHSDWFEKGPRFENTMRRLQEFDDQT